MRLRGCLPAEATLVRLRRYGGCAWGKVDCERVQDCHFYSRLNFKLNRAAALAEVASIIERIDLGCTSNLMRVLIGLTEDVYLLSPKRIAGAADGAQWVIAAMLHK